MDKKSLPVLHDANNLNISFPDKNIHIKEKDALQTRALIKNNGAYTPDAQTYINKNAIPHLLTTDKKGSNKFYLELNSEDKFENGNNNYVSTASVQKELSKRIQEPRDTINKEKYKDTEQCLIAFRDTPELDKIREIKESEIRRDLPSAKKKKLEGLTVDELTGEDLNKPEVHHIERVADNPKKALEDNNLIVVNQKTHHKIHKENAESKESLGDLCDKEGWERPKC